MLPLSVFFTLFQSGGEYLGFLYDSGRDIEVSTINVLNKCSSKNRPFNVKPVVAVFKVGTNV